MTTQGESALSKKIIDACNRLPRTTAHKVAVGPYHRAGEPDIDVVTDGRAVKLEVKLPKSEAAIRRAVTPLQRSRLVEYERAGARVGVVVSVEEALHVTQADYTDECDLCAPIRARWASASVSDGDDELVVASDG